MADSERYLLCFFGIESLQLSSGNVEDVVAPLTSFITHVLHFLECLYDPWFGWHKQLRGFVQVYCLFCLCKTDKHIVNFRKQLLIVLVSPL